MQIAISEKSLGTLLRAIEELRKIDADMPSQMASTFLLIALKPGRTVGDIESALGLSQSSASRNVAALSERVHDRRNGQVGRGLVEYRSDPRDYRRRELHLTERGHEMVVRLLKIMRDGGAEE